MFARTHRRTRRIAIYAALGLWTLIGTACEDEKCKLDVAAAKEASEQARKENGALRSEIAGLRIKAAQVEALTAQVQSLTREKEALLTDHAPSMPPRTSRSSLQ